MVPSTAASASLWALMPATKGPIDVDWFALPSNDHPFIPQNFYRMSGGADQHERFEQIGQSWGKHAFAAASSNSCGFGCNGVGGSHLGSGCSDAYGVGFERRAKPASVRARGSIHSPEISRVQQRTITAATFMT